MSDPAPDIRDGPLPDLGHERLRLSVVAALDGLDTASTQMGGALLLLRTTLDFAETFLAAVAPMQQTVADLTGRVAALEQAAAPTGGPA